jgi:DNA-binding MarR family transcriptional regulator
MVVSARRSESAMAAWRSFLTLHARLTEVLERELQERAGLPLTWYDVLVQLTEAPDQRLRMHELASRVLLSRAGLTRLVDRMAAAGLVERIPCPDDRRGTFVAITPAGRRANVDAAPAHLSGIDEHFASALEPREIAVIEGAFSRLLQRLEGREHRNEAGAG